MKLRGLLLLVALLVVTSGVPLFPHHAVGEVYDETQTVTLEGDIVRLVYRNPHSLIHLEVPGQRGVRHTWAIELRGVDRLRQRGQGEDRLQPGDHVIVCGNPGRDPGQFRLRLLALTRSAGGPSAPASAC